MRSPVKMADHLKWSDGSGDCDVIIQQPFRRLRELLVETSAYSEQYEAKEVHRRFYRGFKSMLDVMDRLEELAVKLVEAAPQYDFSQDVKGNGFRSLLSILQHCVRVVSELVLYCQAHREKFYFRTHHYSLEVEAYGVLLQHTLQMFEYANRMIPEDGSRGNLFTETFPPDLMMEVENVDNTCFYGRTLGFQFPSAGMRHFLHVVCVTMASFADGYSNHKSNQSALVATSFLNSGKYSVNPEMRARMIASVTQKTSMEFCKAFWNITEHYGFQHIPLLMCSALKVNRVFHIPPEPFDLMAENGELVSISPPCSWSGLAPVQVRLLSYEWREGQSKDGNDSHSSYGKRPSQKSSGFVLHMHGGGFVAQSSKSHEMYLRNWARELNVPILSVDYSLAPEAPFPRALEECFFAYAWALKNKDLLGTTAEFVCIAGDSAGGNLSVVTSLRAAQYGIRMPDSILAAYSPFNMQYVPTPSRVFSLMDPLLPTGILGACLLGYTGMEKSPFDECTIEAINSHTEKFTRPTKGSHGERTKSGTFLGLFKGSKEKQEQHSSPQPQQLSVEPSSFDSFHSCNSSWSQQNGSLGTPGGPANRSKLLPNGGHVVGKNLQSAPSKANNSPADDELSCSEHCIDISFPELPHNETDLNNSDGGTENTSSPLSTSSPRQERRGKSPDLSPPGGVTDSHIGVVYHKDGDDCSVVDVVERADSPTGEAMVLPHLPPDKRAVEERDRNPVPARSRSVSQLDLPIAKNPFMSPLLASEEMLATLPPVDLVACTLDPILDDSVEFARRLRAVGNDVELYILENLPHGFLTFNLVCQESREGCDLCVACLQRTLTGNRLAKHKEKAPVY